MRKLSAHSSARLLRRTALALAVGSLFGTVCAAPVLDAAGIETAVRVVGQTISDSSTPFSAANTDVSSLSGLPSASAGNLAQQHLVQNSAAAPDGLTLDNLSLSYTLSYPDSAPAFSSDSLQFTGSALAVEPGSWLELTGDSTEISFTAENAFGYSALPLSSAVTVGGTGAGSAELTVVSGKTEVRAESYGSDSPGLAGLILDKGGALEVQNGELKVVASSEGTGYSAGSRFDEHPYQVIGLYAKTDNGGITTESASKLTVDALGTAASSSNPVSPATSVIGLYAEGGTHTFGGEVGVQASTALPGARACGLCLMTGAMTEAPADANLTASFAKAVTIRASASDGQADGLLVGGTRYDAGSYTPENFGKADVTFEGLTAITAISGGESAESHGLAFNTWGGVGGTVTFAGTATINADDALYIYSDWDDIAEAEVYPHRSSDGFYTVRNYGTLMLNGRVSNYSGLFEQISGTTVLTSTNGAFFGGKVIVSGGTLTSDAPFVSNEQTGLTPSLRIIGGTLNLPGLSIAAHNLDTTYVKLLSSGSKLNINGDLTIASDAKLGFNAGTILITNGNSSIAGTVNTTKNEFEAGSPRPEETTGTLQISGGRFTLESGGRLELNSLLILNGAVFTRAGTLLFNTLELDSDSSLVNYVADSPGELFNFGDTTVRLYGGQILQSDGVTPCSVWVAGTSSLLEIKEGDYQLESAEFKDHFKVSNGSLTTNSLIVGNVATVGYNGILETDLLTVDSDSGAYIYVQDGGTFRTRSGQVFDYALDAEALSVTDAGGFIYPTQTGLILGDGSTLAITDPKYNLLYEESALRNLSAVFGDTDFTLMFTGDLVGSGEGGGEEDGTVSIDDLPSDGVIHDGTIVRIPTADGENTAVIDKSFGSSSIRIESGNVEGIRIEGDLVLTGGSTQETELFDFAGGSALNKTIAVDGSLVLGNPASENNKGKISSVVIAQEDGSVEIAAGEFELSDIHGENGGSIVVIGGKATIDNIVLDGGSLTVSGGTLEGGELTLGDSSVISGGSGFKVDSIYAENAGDASHTLTGGLEAGIIEAEDGANSILNIGSSSENGSLTVREESDWSGFRIYVSGNPSAAAESSKFLYGGTTVGGLVTVGPNGFAAMGATNADKFLNLFTAEGGFLWGSGTGGFNSALYAAKPITIPSEGGILVDSSSTVGNWAPGGSLVLGNGALFVTDASALGGRAAVTAESFRVSGSALGVLIGVEENKVYRLTDYAEGTTPSSDDKLFSNSNIRASSSLWQLTMADNGDITAKRRKAEEMFDGLMQGTELADAVSVKNDAWGMGMLNEEYLRGSKQTAAVFDAAMNPAGASAVYTTAFDRSDELRRIVRSEAGIGRSAHVWAHLTGGRTELDGMSTGAQPLSVKTDYYGVAFGFEKKLKKEHVRVGLAASVGSGKSKNDFASAQDEFSYASLSLYGRSALGGIGLIGDASLTLMKSDLSVAGKADVKTDVTTGVLSFALQAQRTFDVWGLYLTPFIAADLYYLRSEDFGNGHGAEVSKADAFTAEFPIGIRVEKAFTTKKKTWIAPYFSISAVPTTGNDIDAKVSYAGAESSYSFIFADGMKYRSDFGLNVQRKRLQYGLAGVYEKGDEERSHYSLQARLKYAF